MPDSDTMVFYYKNRGMVKWIKILMRKLTKE